MQKKDSILAAFLADSYSLGSHWIYDAAQLKALVLDWAHLNDPAASWHSGKEKGDFTHYGDHTLWLLEYLEAKRSFDVVDYAKFWQEKMQSFEGYVDGSSRETLEHLQALKSAREGVVSHDLSICGRIAPLLLISEALDDFIDRSISFAKMSHNDALVLEAVHFFATLLYSVLDGDDLGSALKGMLPHYSETIVAWVDAGLESVKDDSFEAIRKMGPACGVEGGFAATIHLIFKYDDLYEMMKENAKAGGDSAARGMIAAMILAAGSKQDLFLVDEMKQAKLINSLLDRF